MQADSTVLLLTYKVLSFVTCYRCCPVLRQLVPCNRYCPSVHTHSTVAQADSTVLLCTHKALFLVTCNRYCPVGIVPCFVQYVLSISAYTRYCAVAQADSTVLLCTHKALSFNTCASYCLVMHVQGTVLSCKSLSNRAFTMYFPLLKPHNTVL